MTILDLDPTNSSPTEPTAAFVASLMALRQGEPMTDQASAGIFALARLSWAKTEDGVSFWNKKLANIESGDEDIIADTMANRALSRERSAALISRIAALESELFTD